MSLFEYDFGYGWLWNYGHLIAVAFFGALAVLAWRLKWSRWTTAISVALVVWGIAGFLIVQTVMRMNLPLELPTDQFLPEGAGQVLDAGAGSGRSSLMVLLSRPDSQVVALDLFDGYFGIEDNKPERLFTNAEKAGVEDRLQAQVGDVRAMPFDDGSLDAAVSAYMIDHLGREDVERSLAEIGRVLRADGQFLLIVINPDIWTRVAFPFFMHHGYFGGSTNHDRWRSQLQNAGFEIVEQGTTPGTLYLLAKKGGVAAAPTSSD